ncbi:MAG: hypothetical protein WBF42_08750, partial [Terracidiphilus sp.]
MDTPHTLHRAKTVSQHLSTAHRSTHRAHAKSTTSVHHRSTASASVTRTSATLRRASLHTRRHRYYERFTASS